MRHVKKHVRIWLIGLIGFSGTSQHFGPFKAENKGSLSFVLPHVENGQGSLVFSFQRPKVALDS